MKRSMLSAVFFVVCLVLPLSSAWAVWEGNAGIAAASEFSSSGLFAKSDMFPRNTLVEIQNLETGKKVRMVITGSAGVPGLVVLVSPEAATALNIKPGTLTRVRISVPSAVAEKPALGTVSSGSALKNNDPDSNPEAAARTANLAVRETLPEVNAETIETVVPDAPVSREEFVATTGSEIDSSPEIAEIAEIPEPVVVAEPPVVPDAEEPVVAFASDEAPSAPAVSSFASSYSNEPELVIPSNGTDTLATADSEIGDATERTEADPLPEAAVPESPEIAASPDTPPSVPEVASVQEPSAPELPAEEPVSVVAEISLEPAEQIIPRATVPEIAPVPVVPPISDTRKEPATVPSEPVPASIPVVGSIVPPSQNNEAPVPAGASDIPETARDPSTVVSTDFGGKQEIPFADQLEKGSYYIQIASYSEEKNVRTIVDNYGSVYPLAVQKTDGKNGFVLKVYVGPVNKDEYGAVLERFRLLGFRDAFARKVP